jgi:hypothetical protein
MVGVRQASLTCTNPENLNTEWIETQTWYTCDMKWSIPASVKAYTGTSGKRHDKALAEELCDLQAVFWAPNSTCSWKSTSGSNRAGWMVQAISHHEEDGDVLLNVSSVHRSDHHKHGDIRVTSSHGRTSIRSIIQLHGAREREGGLRISLSATEIGDPTAYPWVGKPPHTQSTCPARLISFRRIKKVRNKNVMMILLQQNKKRLEPTPNSIITHWITLWKQLSEWERLGGRNLHWVISTVCRQHYQLNVLMDTYILTADPSF